MIRVWQVFKPWSVIVVTVILGGISFVVLLTVYEYQRYWIAAGFSIGYCILILLGIVFNIPGWLGRFGFWPKFE